MIIQMAPGGPVEMAISKIKGRSTESISRITHGNQGEVQDSQNSSKTSNSFKSKYRGSEGISPELIKDLEKQFGLDKPLLQRFFLMMKNYLTFNFGNSFYKDRKVLDLFVERIPISISLGLWTTLLVYLISIPLGIKKAIKDGSKFDLATSFVTTIGYAIPGFLFAILLIILFSGGKLPQSLIKVEMNPLNTESEEHDLILSKSSKIFLSQS
jgi:microcin C transport system permease protein